MGYLYLFNHDEFDRTGMLILVCLAGEHAESVSKPLHRMWQQQHGAVRAAQHDAYCREGFRCRLFQARLSCIHSVISNYRSNPGVAF